LLVAASVVPSSPVLVSLMKEALGSSETSVLTRVTALKTSNLTYEEHFVGIASVQNEEADTMLKEYRL
jgi:hypothetical protein